ncbi:odorant receptor 67d-like [Scaptodrosophila lebanonensis]|uniref:Odorant receptor n=1 Tax=Drosophila lebanonensis TaxID=7225 RepID=A0A6J2T859_DROLE|nr:odorant receptor 67d-like [Scaptodrosophila lebanonensis]
MASTAIGNLGSLARYRRIIDVIRLCARFCGTDISSPDWRWNWLTRLVVVMIFSFYTCTIYTVYEGVFVQKDRTIIMQATCFLGGAVQGMTKMFCCISYRQALRESQALLDATFMKYEQKHMGYQQVLIDGIAMTMRGIKSFVVFIGIALAIIIGFPISYYILYNKKIMIMQLLVPGIDPNTNTGFLILIGAHIACLFLGAFGNFAGDMYLFVFINNLPMLKNILGCRLQDLNDLLDGNCSQAELHAEMVKIVNLHQQYLSLLERSQRIFFHPIFVQIFATASGILCTMFCLVMGVWPAAPAYLGYGIVTLYFYCGLGSIVEASNDDCCTIIYTKCQWYRLPLPYQKLLLFMLHKSQTMKNLTVGNMMPLSMTTAMNLSKAVYSLLMLLLNNADDVGGSVKSE